MTECPCGSKIAFSTCCEPFLKEKKTPDTAEKLMRSRYTAYTLGNMDYVEKTMAGEALKIFDRESAQIWSDHSDWQGLQIIKKGDTKESESVAFVEFIASYKLNGKTKFLHEVSEFKKNSGAWYYVNGKSSISHDKSKVLESSKS